MKDASREEAPRLAAPGAGLPWMELQIARLIFRWQFRQSSRQSAAGLIDAERSEILRLGESCDETLGAQRVLIQRLPGMEDSSRHWSVFMTIDHLRIVNALLAETIGLLGQGKVPGRVASTAAVKPDPDVGATVLPSFRESCADIARVVGEIENLRTTTRYAHPWFGPLNAAEWHFMAGFHMRLHRRQVEAILRGLSEE